MDFAYLLGYFIGVIIIPFIFSCIRVRSLYISLRPEEYANVSIMDKTGWFLLCFVFLGLFASDIEVVGIMIIWLLVWCLPCIVLKFIMRRRCVKPKHRQEDTLEKVKESSDSQNAG